jgi:putative ATP-binding cassette transporter
MVRVREYSESIALDRGEEVERSQLDNRFGLVLGNYLALIRAQKRLVWFTSFFGQAAVVFPFVVAAPRFFSGAIQLGVLVQISSAFGQVQGALSWFVDNYSSLAAWRATTDRLTSFEASFQALALTSKGLSATDSEVLSSQDLHLELPNGTVLLHQTHLQAQPGDSILLSGPSGAGKSTLFRALAGIWPFASGHLNRPADSMFIPQRPYFPNGPLRNALAYPQEASQYSDDELRAALDNALLPDLTGRLDEVGAWSQVLSGGEQQRLAVARVLLKKPRWIFADEATSALDEPTEHLIYKTLLAHVKQGQGAIISIAHKPTVGAFHTSRWIVEKLSEADVASYRLRAEAAPA